MPKSTTTHLPEPGAYTVHARDGRTINIEVVRPRTDLIVPTMIAVAVLSLAMLAWVVI